MRPEAYMVISGTVVSVPANATAELTAQDKMRFLRVATDQAIFFAVTEDGDPDITADTGAPLPAGDREYIYVPPGFVVKFFGGAATATVSLNEVGNAFN